MKIESFWKNCSIVIPCRSNESEQFKLLNDLASFAEESEIFIVEAHRGHNLRSSNLPQNPNVKIVSTSPGRAKQLNYGAQLATRKFLWFLHADSRFIPDTVSDLKALTNLDEETLYYFKLRFQNDGPKPCVLNAFGANMRSQLFKMPFGDQSYLLSKQIFERIGKFNEELNYAEDFEFIRQANRVKIPIEGLPIKISTSARKYQQRGWVKTTAEHLNFLVRNW